MMRIITFITSVSVLLTIGLVNRQVPIAQVASQLMRQDKTSKSGEDKEEESRQRKAKALERFTLSLLIRAPVIRESDTMQPELLPIYIDYVAKAVDEYAQQVKNDHAKKNELFDELAGKLVKGELDDYVKEVIKKNWGPIQQ